MRLFVALDLPDEIKDRISKLKDVSLSGAKWTKREQWHITLHFIGEIESDTAIRDALRTVEANSFTLKLSRTGTFPPKGKPRVLWTGIEAPSALQTLYQKVGDALKTTGFTPDKRPYNPHLTLARFKYKAPSARVMTDYHADNANFETDSFTVSEFALYQSDLNPHGAIYTILEKFPLIP